MPESNNHNLLEKNTNTILSVGQMLLKEWHSVDVHHFKEARDICTNLDIKAEQMILKHLHQEYPDYNIIAEEDGEHSRDSEYTWVIDPIDGSKNFLYHLPFFNITIALLHNGQTIFGIIYSPVTQELFYAEKNTGAYLIPISNEFTLILDKQQQLNISEQTLLNQATIHSELPTVHKNPDDEECLTTVNKFFSSCYRLRSIGSGALALAYTAMGAYDGYIDFSRTTNIWDVAAGILLVREAGGIVTDFSGNQITSESSQSIVATNPILHKQIMQILSS